MIRSGLALSPCSLSLRINSPADTLVVRLSCLRPSFCHLHPRHLAPHAEIIRSVVIVIEPSKVTLHVVLERENVRTDWKQGWVRKRDLLRLATMNAHTSRSHSLPIFRPPFRSLPSSTNSLSISRNGAPRCRYIFASLVREPICPTVDFSLRLLFRACLLACLLVHFRV